MVRLAEQLGARVQGDEGELYPGDAPVTGHSAPGAGSATPRPPTSWWQRLIGR